MSSPNFAFSSPLKPYEDAAHIAASTLQSELPGIAIGLRGESFHTYKVELPGQPLFFISFRPMEIAALGGNSQRVAEELCRKIKMKAGGYDRSERFGLAARSE